VREICKCKLSIIDLFTLLLSKPLFLLLGTAEFPWNGLANRIGSHLTLEESYGGLPQSLDGNILLIVVGHKGFQASSSGLSQSTY